MKRILLLLPVIPALFFLFGCSDSGTGNKSIEDLHREQGIPVLTQIIKYELFENKLTYFATVSGIQQSFAGAPIDGKIEKILVNVGDRVKKDQVIITLPEDSPASKYNQVRVAFDNARTAYQRIESLYQAGGVSRQDRDNMRTRYEAMKADWDAVRQSVKVKAPISGTLTSLFVSETDNVKQKDPIAIVSRTDKLKSFVWIAEKDIAKIRAGSEATALWLGNKIHGKVAHIDMAMDMRRKAFRTLIEFENPENILKPGITAEITITQYRNENAVVIRHQYISVSGDQQYVYLFKDGYAERRDIVTGSRNGFDMEVTEGLHPGDRLIISGLHLLSDKCKVKPVDNSASSN